MEQHRDFLVANLTEVQVDALLQMESKLRQETGEEIILVAYEHQAD